MTRQIRLLVLDVDGVITDGSVLLLPSGEEARSVHFRDLDAVAKVRRHGIEVAILSGEDTPSSHRVADRFGIGEAVWGSKDKLPALLDLTARLGVTIEEACYVGDSDRDAAALDAAGLGYAPADATELARMAADQVLDAPGGRGAVAEVVTLLERTREVPR
jgi:3-deoxy-D-manno-octulosonate 8-phosphate phosphatase (KDO 8-P phosphatase)